MPLDQLSTPTIRPPTSLDLLDASPEEGGALEASSASGGDTTPTLRPPTSVGGGAGTLPGPDVSAFARQQMANPSRYGLDVVKQGVDLINSELAHDQTRGIADMDEFYSSRGLVGSSVEGQGRGDFLSQLNRTKEQRMFNLVREMATTYGADVQAAGQLGLQARQQELEMAGMDRDDAYRYAVLEQSGGQFQQSLAFDRERFGAELGLSRQQLDLQRDEMTARYADSNANRLHQMAMQQGSQEYQAAQNDLNRILEREALKLQRDGMDAESAWREADRLMQERLEGRALDLQSQGMALDEAYRRAAMDLDAQMANQQAALSAADIYLRALAAGVGDTTTIGLPQYPGVGGGTTQPPAGGGTGPARPNPNPNLPGGGTGPGTLPTGPSTPVLPPPTTPTIDPATGLPIDPATGQPTLPWYPTVGGGGGGGGSGLRPPIAL